MHYAPVFSDFLVTGSLPRREQVQAKVVRHYHARAGSWRNWWNMSVADTGTKARSVGARGRLPGV